MKQNKLKTLALVLALALVLSLAVCMLVACNPKDDNTTGGNQNTPGEDGNKLSGFAKIFSEEQFNALVGYLYSTNAENNTDGSVYMYYYNAETIAANAPDKLELQNGFITATVRILYGYDSEKDSYSDKKTIVISYLSTPEEANTILEATKNDRWEFAFEFDPEEAKIAHTFGNVAVLESEEGLYEKLMASTIPDTVSAARKEMLKLSYDEIASNNFVGFGILDIYKTTNNEQNDQIIDELYFENEPVHGDCCENLIYTNYADDVARLKKEWEQDSIFYTSDSFFDDAKESGYAFEYSKDKPGFVYNIYSDIINTITGYNQTEDEMDEIIFPAELDGHKIESVSMYSIGKVKNVVISEGITSVSFGYHDITADIQNITLPSSITSVGLNCPDLKTVNYAGSTADFEQKLGESANRWCHVNIGYDSETHGSIYKDITITVVCKDGTLTYPNNNAQA